MKYSEWLGEWLETCAKPNVTPRTFESYKAIVRLHIAPKIGRFPLTELTASVLQKFIAEMSANYAANTVSCIIAVIRGSLFRAEKTGVVEKQYAECIQRPRIREKKVECFTPTEQKKLEKYIFERLERHKLFGIIITLYTGLRIGELLALEWTDIDFKRARLTVTKTARDIWKGGYKKVISDPKTKNSARVIPFARQLVPYLRTLKKLSKSKYVISEGDGRDVPIRSYQRTFELLLKRLKMPHRGFHSLRHTFATRAIECGVDVKTLSEILGHKDSSITLNRYAHSLMEHKILMMNRLGKSLYAEAPLPAANKFDSVAIIPSTSVNAVPLA